jgi:hypothetical protein
MVAIGITGLATSEPLAELGRRRPAQMIMAPILTMVVFGSALTAFTAFTTLP